MRIQEIFDTMSYGPAPESDAEAQAWLAKYDRQFGCFIGGAFTEPTALFATRNPANGAMLAEVSDGASLIDQAVVAARAAQPGWAGQSGHKRARVLYALARLVQKHARLFAVLETLDTGKPIRESRDIDIPLVARHFYYHAGMAQLMAEELPDRAPLGVCGQIIPWNFPLLMLAWKIAPALAMGNSVVLKPAEWTPLTALLFAEICLEAGVPAGVVNIVTGDGAAGAALAAHPDVNKVAFTGSTAVGREIRRATAGQGKSLTLELGGKSPFIVFDDADLDSAVEGVVDAIWFNGGQVCCAGSRLLVHEPVAEAFHAKLRARMARLRVGDPMDKCIDVGAMVDPAHLARIEGMVSETGGEVHRVGDLPDGGAYCAPTLITGLDQADPLMQAEIFGPVLVSCSFRTPAEAVALANNTAYGLAASIWSENVNLALGIAPQLRAGVIWVNGTNMFDAAAGFGGVKESGFGREGGWEGLRAYTRPKAEAPALSQLSPFEGAGDAVPALDRTAKMYIGGKQARPDSGYSRPVFSTDGALAGHVGKGSRKDIRNAVEAAQKAQAGWDKAGGALRAQVLYFLAENLSARGAEFAQRLGAFGAADGAAEVAASIDRLFTWAAWADKNDGAVKPVPLRGVTMAMNEPVGVIGAMAPEAPGLLGLVSILGPALATGNGIVLVPSAAMALMATDFYQLLDTSDVPGGVVNIVTGDAAELASVLADHADVDAVWSFAGQDLSQDIESRAAGNLKRVWVPRQFDWDTANTSVFRAEACETKTIWTPYGE